MLGNRHLMASSLLSHGCYCVVERVDSNLFIIFVMITGFFSLYKNKKGQVWSFCTLDYKQYNFNSPQKTFFLLRLFLIDRVQHFLTRSLQIFHMRRVQCFNTRFTYLEIFDIMWDLVQKSGTAICQHYYTSTIKQLLYRVESQQKRGSQGRSLYASPL